MELSKEKIALRVLFKLKAGAELEFANLARAFVERTQPEPGTLSYGFFTNRILMEYISLEVYENYEALKAHQEANKDLRERAKELTDSIELQVLAEISLELQVLLQDADPTYYSPVAATEAT